MKKLWYILLLLLICQYPIRADEEQKEHAPVKKVVFEKSVLKEFSSLPIQSDGRIKPLNTYASFLLLRLSGKRVVRDESGAQILPMEWFLTALFYPEISYQQKIFIVDNSEVLESVGLENAKQRDRYSYKELEPYIGDLFNKSDVILKIESDNRTLLEQQTLNLAMNLYDYANLLKALSFARPMNQKSEIGITLDKPPRHIIAQMMKAQQGVWKDEHFKNLSDEKKKLVVDNLNQIALEAKELFQFSDWMAMVPPSDNKADKWLTPNDLLMAEKQVAASLDIFAVLDIWEETCIAIDAQKENDATFQKLAHTLHEQIDKQLSKKTLNKIKLENLYYAYDLIYNSLLLFGFLFMSICFSLMKPSSKKWHIFNHIGLLTPLSLLILAIGVRCYIMERPPVATLYESILFITAIMCLVCFVVEHIFKNRIAAFTSSVFGLGGLFLSYRFEMGDAKDTMGNLEAVLNSNFWLSTHVTTVTIGYAAGLLASAFAHVYVISKMFRLTTDESFYKMIHKLIYGILCFCILFATVGTILGGIWANYSWGRFWGWDPKENGALAIVLWTLIILHGRLDRIFSEFYFMVMTILGGMVVVASWWGVNQLGVGMHSYGFTTGITKRLILFAVIELTILFTGLIQHHFIEKNNKTPGS